MKSDAAASNEGELDIIHSFEIKPYLTEKVKLFQAGCIKNPISDWASHTMEKKILGSASGLSLEFSDNKLPHYHKRMEMRFSSKEELFLACENENLLKKVSQRNHNMKRENSYLLFSSCQNLTIPLEWF